MCVRVCVNPSLLDDLSPIQFRIIIFGPEVQSTFFKIPIVLGFVDLDFQGKFNLKIKIYPILSLPTQQPNTYPI